MYIKNILKWNVSAHQKSSLHPLFCFNHLRQWLHAHTHKMKFYPVWFSAKGMSSGKEDWNWLLNFSAMILRHTQCWCLVEHVSHTDLRIIVFYTTCCSHIFICKLEMLGLSYVIKRIKLSEWHGNIDLPPSNIRPNGKTY